VRSVQLKVSRCVSAMNGAKSPFFKMPGFAENFGFLHVRKKALNKWLDCERKIRLQFDHMHGK